MLDAPALIVLAAGASTRFGSPKQLAPVKGAAMLRTVLERAVDVAPGKVTVVLGAHVDAIRPQIEEIPAAIVVNAHWQEGLGSSLCTGIQSLPDDAGAALVWLGDQVGVTVDDLRRLIGAWNRDTVRIAASSYGGTVGVPAIFPGSYFAQLLGIHGDQGAKAVLMRHAERTTLVDMPNASIDVDTPADLEKLAPSTEGKAREAS